MTFRIFLVSLGCVVAAAGCGSPVSPTAMISTASQVVSAAGPTTLPGPSVTPGSLRIEGAVVIEFQYPGNPGWFYAPQVRVTATGETGALSVTGADISIPGHTFWACTTAQSIVAGQTRELFPEIYGDYPLTFDKSGHRSSGDVRIVVRFVDQLGQAGALTVIAPITSGGLPTSYSGGSGTWSCR